MSHVRECPIYLNGPKVELQLTPDQIIDVEKFEAELAEASLNRQQTVLHLGTKDKGRKEG
jgi:hypothetical protein